MILPIGVRGQAEDGDITRGTEPGAPTKANMRWKVKITTIIAFILWLIICTVITFGLIDLEWLVGSIEDF